VTIAAEDDRNQDVTEEAQKSLNKTRERPESVAESFSLIASVAALRGYLSPIIFLCVLWFSTTP
jgi:hypothetical protein